ncbi:MAG: efflux RND transporter periplasmic adaptor subunit [Candidatus Rokubacteria bacterium]|nr:efflux RND transporter periplasmic adaptor subunit [Candidatus Rokubacteria bacterium]
MTLLQRHRVPLVLVGLGVLLAALVGHRILKQQAAAVPRRQIEIVVGVVEPVRTDLDVKLAYSADVLPDKQVAIFSKVSGYIRRLGAEPGEFVRAGQLLVEVEALELAAAVEQARAAVGTAEANVKVAGSNLEAARAGAANQEANLVRARAVADNDARNAARLEDLHQRGLISQMDRDNARTTAESSRAQVAAAEAQVAVARSQIETQRSQVTLARANLDRERATLRIAQTNLDNTRVTAPFAGYISARNLYPGAAVSSQAAGTSNSSVGILVLQSLDPARVQVDVEARHIALVRPGAVGRVYVDAYPGRTFEARVTRVLQALDPRARTLGIEMEIPNPDLLLKPGMYARVELIVGHHPGALLVPNEAIASETDGTTAVFVVRNGVVARRPVTTGVNEGTRVEITKGLAGDELVIVEGKELTREGVRVRAERRK